LVKNRGECVPGLLNLIAQGNLKPFAKNSFSLSQVKEAFEALSSRRTIGKVVLPYKGLRPAKLHERSGRATNG